MSGDKSLTNVKQLPEVFKQNAYLIIDGGEAKIGVASTIIKVEEEKIKILREGPITKEELESVIRKEKN